jgi:hypothetical protein
VQRSERRSQKLTHTHFDYIEGFYNSSRRHSSIGYMSPADYERAIVEEVKVALSEKASIKLLQFHPQYTILHPGLLPAVEAARDHPPRTVALGKVAPRGSGATYPEHAVYDTAMIGVGAALWGLLGGRCGSKRSHCWSVKSPRGMPQAFPHHGFANRP